MNVPFSQKDEAKSRGARWDPLARRWYAPQPDMPDLKPWTPLPDVLPGEDRSFGAGLFVDLVPSSCWFTNARTCLNARDWKRLRRMVLRRAGGKCEVCGRGEERQMKRQLELHERWAFDGETRVQRLRRLVCLCSDCHAVTHFGLAEIRGKESEAIAHLRTVTGMTVSEAEAHVDEARAVWSERCATAWELDLGILVDSGIAISPPPKAMSRAEIARETLERGRHPASEGWGSTRPMVEMPCSGSWSEPRTARSPTRPWWVRLMRWLRR